MLNRIYVPTDLEIRRSGDGDADRRTIFGTLVPFDEPAEIHENGQRFVETVRFGAFARTIAERGPERVKLHAMHNARQLPLGRAVELREDRSGLFGAFKVSRTAAGDEALELVRDQTVDAFSIGFTATGAGERWSPDGVREVIEARLHEVSLVSAPAYTGALVAGIRSATYSADLDPELLERRLRLATLTRS